MEAKSSAMKSWITHVYFWLHEKPQDRVGLCVSTFAEAYELMRLCRRYQWRGDSRRLRALGTLSKRQRYSVRHHLVLILDVLHPSWDNIFSTRPRNHLVSPHHWYCRHKITDPWQRWSPSIPLSLVPPKVNVGDPSLCRRSSARSSAMKGWIPRV